MSTYPVIVYAPDGDFIELKAKGFHTPRSNTFQRGTITEFSRKSRSRLLKKVAQLKRGVLPLFVTLTYPDAFPADWKTVKKHAHKFWIYLLRAYPGSGGIWKLELQKRGAFHFHILLYGVSIEDARKFIPPVWYAIVGSSDPKHLAWHRGELDRNYHCVQPVRSWQGVKSYASKYFTKEEKITGDGTGRIWGVRGIVPLSQLLEMRIDIRTALEFRRAFRRAKGFKPRRFGFWAFNQSPDWIRYIETLEKELTEKNNPENFPPGWYLGVDISGVWSGDDLEQRFDESPLDFF